jgi:hypothetical protein
MFLSACLGMLCWQHATAEPKVDFDRDVKPILSDRCYACHGPDGGQHGEKWKGGLRLDLKHTALADLSAEKLRIANLKRRADGEPDITKQGAPRYAIVPGKPEESLLVERIMTDDPDDIMPPIDSKLSLSDKEKAILKQWIDEGAEWKTHWAFSPIKKPALPKVKNRKWTQEKFDQFVLSKLETRNIPPSPPADSLTWLRRVSLGLTGLPPSLDMQNRILKKDSGKVRAEIVDELLESPAHAERLATVWMDLSRYSDTHGYQYDPHRNNWPWRDWVIKAFEDNIPYDEFVTQQLAGDLLENPTDDMLIATAFNRHHPFTIEGGVIPEEYRVSYVNDRTTTFGTVFLGLTLECSRCHNHKYDPITQKEYYQLSSFFSNIDEQGVGGGMKPKAPPMLPYRSTDTRELQEIENELAVIEAQLIAPMEESGAFSDAERFHLQVLDDITIRSEQGLRMKVDKHAAILAIGKAPETDKVVVQGKLAPGTYSSFILEALTHSSLPQHGPGLADDGNAVLSFFQVEALNDDGDYTALEFDPKKAFATAEQPIMKQTVDRALHPDNDGWGLQAFMTNENKTATFELKQPLVVAEPGTLKVTLEFRSEHKHHQFGCFRVSAAKASSKELIAAFKEKLPPKEYYERQHNKAARLEKDPALKKQYDELLKRQAQLKSIEPVDVMIMREQKPGKQKNYVLIRGEYSNHGEEVFPETPAVLPGFGDRPRNRLGLAQWLVDPENPLFARVTINHLWQLCFGDGLVRTAEDFGRQGAAPTHPELLDWLAADLMEHGWDIRRSLKSMVLSATYAQSSAIRPELDDPANLLLASGPRFRLPAEMIRDQALASSGLLVTKIGGPSVKPYQPLGLWKELVSRTKFQMVYTVGQGEDLYRRSLYTYWKRALHPPAMAAFDAPNREVCTAKRSRTNTPIQALVMLHDPTFIECSRFLADRVLREEDALEDRITLAFRLALGREPGSEELSILSGLFSQHLDSLGGDVEKSRRQLGVGQGEHTADLDWPSLAAMSVVCQAIYNSSEFVTHR